MQKLFGYAAETTAPGTGYLDPEDPQWQKSVEHIQERQKKPGGLGTFGPQSGMTRGEPTRDEWQVTSYLDSLGVAYTHKMKLEDIDPTEPRGKIEYDIFLNTYLMAIETSPGWHEGGSSEGSFPRVIENDRYKKQFAQEHGIDLMVFDPAHGTEKFINNELAPRLLAVGVDAYQVSEPKSEDVVSEHQWNQPMGGAPAYQESDDKHCSVCKKPLVTYTDQYGEKRCGSCNARLGYGKDEAYGKTTPYATCPICHNIMLTEEYDNHIMHSHNQEQRDHAGIKSEAFDQSQNTPRFPERGKVNTITQTDEGFDKPLEAPGHLFHEEVISDEMKKRMQLYRPTKVTCKECGKEFVSPTGSADYCENCIGKRQSALEEEDHFNGGVEGGPIGDFYLHKSNATQGKGSESPMQTNYGYNEQDDRIDTVLATKCPIHRTPYHQHTSEELGEDLAKYEEEYPTTDQTAEKGNPFAKSPMVYRHVGMEEAHTHECPKCGSEMYAVDMAETQYRCPNWKGDCPNADSGNPAVECPKCLQKFLRGT